MEINYPALIHILTESPGDLVYHLVVSLACLITGIIAGINLKYPQKSSSAKRILIASAVLFAVQILIFTLEIIFHTTAFNNSPPLAMLERTAYGVLIIWLIWIFFEKDTRFLLTGISIFLTLAMIFFGAGLILLNSLELTIMPEISKLHLALWQFGTLFLILLGIALIIRLRPNQWIIALAMLVVIGGGYLLLIIEFQPDSLGMGAVRLAFTVSLPWILILTQRFADFKPDPMLTNVEQAPNANNDKVDTKPVLVNELLKIGLMEDPEERKNTIIQAICLSTLADICFLVETKQNQEEVTLSTGYDLIRQIFHKPITLKRTDLNQIINTWEANEILQRSQRDLSSRDSTTITDILRIGRHGNVLAYPLLKNDQILMGGLIFLSPYTDRSLLNARILMDTIKDTLTKILFDPNKLEALSADLEREKTAHRTAYEEKDRLSRALLEKETQIKNMEYDLKQWKAKFQIERLDSVQRIDHMKDEITKLRIETTREPDQEGQLEQFQAKIRQLTEERDQLRIALTHAKARIEDFETQSGQTGPIRLSLDSRVISLDAVAANAKLKLAPDLRQKLIDLEIDNPQASAMIKTDPDLLHLVVYNLLDNAVQVSKNGSQVQLNQKLSFETGMLIIQVTDFGPGLTPQEQTALFSTEPPEIPGIGSLDAIREAVRAIRVLNGKIWLRSQKNSFTTFRVQLPVRIID